MQNCIGAIDGTHVPITIFEERAPPYRNRKGTLSQNVMCSCDFDLKFTFISCGWEGSASDAGVLRSLVVRAFTCQWGSSTLLMVDMQKHPHSLLRTTLASLGGIDHMQTIKSCSTTGMLNSVIILKELLACWRNSFKFSKWWPSIQLIIKLKFQQ